MELPKWALGENAVNFIGGDYYQPNPCYYRLVDSPKDGPSTFSALKLMVEKAKGSKLSGLEGYSHSFEMAKNCLGELGMESRCNALEVIVSGLTGEEEALESFRVFCSLISDYYEMEGTCKMDLLGKIPSLKTLAARAFPSSRLGEIQKLPEELRGLVKGLMRDQEKKKSKGKKAGKEEKQPFSFKLFVGGDHLDPLDPEGAHLFDSSKEMYYDRKEQRSWRESEFFFHPNRNSPSISYNISCPQNVNGYQTETSKKIEAATSVVNIFNQDDVKRATPKLWQMMGGSSGGTFTEHNSNFFNIYKEFNVETKKYANVKMEWEHVNSVFGGIQAFVKGIKKTDSLPWKNDGFCTSIVINGKSMEELDVLSDRIRILIASSSLSDHLNRELVDTKCWFSANLNDKNPPLEVLEKAIQKIPCIKFKLDVNFVVPDPDPLSKDHKSAIKQINKRIVIEEKPLQGKEEQKEEQKKEEPKKKKGFLEKLFGKKKKVKPMMLSRAALIEQGPKIWEGTKGGPYRPSLLVTKYLPPPSAFSSFTPPKDINFPQNKTQKGEIWEMQLGCKACVAVLGYRPPCDGMGYHSVANALCCLHKSLLLTNSIHGIPQVEDLSDNTVGSAATSSNLYAFDYGSVPEEENWVGLVTNQMFKDMIGMECGDIISRTMTWDEMSVNQMLKDE